MFWKKKTVKTKESVPLEVLGWRNSMWVMTPDGIGIIFKLGVDSEVHLTDEKGNTFLSKIYKTAALRQAKFNEIPIFRRKIDKEHAALMGYF